MWEKTKRIKCCRSYSLYRYVCSKCGMEVDSRKKPKKCTHEFLYNLDVIFNEIVRSALGVKAGRKRIPLDITKDFIVKLYNKQNGKCALSGIPIQLGKNASLDRIDSSLGYLKSNVQWLHKDVNFMKGSFDEAYLREVCEQICGIQK